METNTVDIWNYSLCIIRYSGEGRWSSMYYFTVLLLGSPSSPTRREHKIIR